MYTIEIAATVKSSGLLLEACLELPKAPGPFPGVVLCHPHPLYGGDMHNKVISAVSRALNKKGVAGLRFNFRGVGRSEGSFAGGLGEQDDAEAALLFLLHREEIDPNRLGILGYSFGGMVALSVADRSSPVKAMAAISPVVPRGVLRNCPKSKLIICGEKDNLIPCSEVLKEAAEMSEPKTLFVIPGADHFWWGEEERAADLAADFFAESI